MNEETKRRVPNDEQCTIRVNSAPPSRHVIVSRFTKDDGSHWLRCVWCQWEMPDAGRQ